MRALIYARLSRATEQSTSIERQVAECRELASRRWPDAAVRVYTDDGVSGAVDLRKRPGFRSLMDEWAPGDVLVFWKIDRLARSLVGFVGLLREAESIGVSLVSVHDPLDLSTPQGRMAAQMLAVFAEFERGVIRDRVVAMRRHLARQGRWTGGRPPYGLKPAPHPDGGKVLVRDEEAAKVIRHIAERIEAGESITGIAADLQRKGVASPRLHSSTKANPVPSAWSAAGIRTILSHPSVAGYQVDPITKRLVRDRGRPVQVWEPVLTEEEQTRILALIPKKERLPTAGHYWLYQVAKCGICGGNLRRYRDNGRNSPNTPSYRCLGPLKARHKMVGCVASRLDDYVNEAVLSTLGGLEYGEREWVGGVSREADLERLREFLDELEDDRKAGLFSTDEGRARYRRLYRETIEEIGEIERAPSQEPGWRMVGTGERLGDVWERMNDQERGDVLRTWNVTVTLYPSPKPRVSVPMSERVVVDFGDLADAAMEMAGVAEAELHDERTLTENDAHSAFVS